MVLTAIRRLERFQNLLPSDLDSIAKCDMNNRYQSNKGEATMLSGENELLIAFWTILQLERYSKMRFCRSITLIRSK